MSAGQYARTQLLIGKDAMEKIRGSRVLIFGVGGVGGCAAEALARSGVGTLGIVDDDYVAETNLNRQILALHSTLGMHKADAAKQRILDIDPETCVQTYKMFYLPENADRIDFSSYDYIVDAIDTVTAKLEIAVRADKAGVPLISAMGCGNRLDPSKLIVTDIYKTDTDPLARVMRRELRKRGVPKLTVVCSTEPAMPRAPGEDTGELKGSRPAPGSTPFVPTAAGYLLASRVIMDLMKS